MNKYYSIVIATVMFVSIAVPSIALTATSSAAKSSPTPTINPEVKDLREKIATKVAELRKISQKAVSGTITDIKNKTIKMQTADGTQYDVTVDDTITVFYQIAGTVKKDLKFTDVKKGAYIIVTGPIIDKTINANAIYLDELFIVKSGKITQINTDNSVISVLSSDKDSFDLTYTRTTKLQLLDIKTLDINTVTISKIKEGDTINFVATKTGTGKDEKFAAQRIFVIPQEYFQK